MEDPFVAADNAGRTVDKAGLRLIVKRFEEASNLVHDFQGERKSQQPKRIGAPLLFAPSSDMSNPCDQDGLGQYAGSKVANLEADS